ncbi:adenylate/guanylate cyclase domain-containing protein [Prosthecobacter dejongeii]|uniref:Class 3 adenylate cyclase n=1 Tax=Prosthecobacter dejongeii TaxID=48465 RepID=A0A7W7YPM5_9BACT|nr:adenylate/guanylate cyclase domain-containing protein [Prosthecobacter dejongeii]MBB5040014.1 class 3 adenylate cyclase [Prosthecobacter dejongeii]
MKLFSSFRAKLILTIFPVVAAVTTGALLLAEWKFSATYQHLFEEQFESQISAVTLAKDRRFHALSTVLERMAQKTELIAAMKEGDYAKAGRDLRPALESLAQERLQSEFTNIGRLTTQPHERKEDHKRPFREPSRSTNSGQSAPFITLINAEGQFVINSRTRSNTIPFPGQANETLQLRRNSDRIPWLSDRKFEEILKQQEVGYLLVEAGERRAEQVREVFITPVRDPQTQTFLGAFVFGLPLPAIADRILYEQTRRSDYGEIMGGIFIEGKLVSSTVPEDQKNVIEKALANALVHSSEDNQEILLSIGHSQHRLIYRILNPDSPFPKALQVNLYPLASLQREILDLRRSAISLAIITLLVAFVLVMLISRSLSGPIRTLVTATQEIERGNYDVRVPVTRDEVGLLAHAFNDMAAGLALQEKYRSILNAVADRTVAERLIENREALGGELRDVAMLFCDIRGFTALTERMPPHEVIDLLNEHMTLLTQVAYNHGGIVDKFVGDLIMVLFGAPITTGHDSQRAVDCAQAMLKARHHLNQKCRHPLEIGIGIATGNVVAGCMGSDQRLSYTVIGHRVNLASRLCSIAQAGEIVVDAETARSLSSTTPIAPLPVMQLKGISEPVEIFRIA